MRISLLAAACVAALVSDAQAQSAVDARLLDRVQVTATRTPRALDRTPASITVLDAARLETDTPGTTMSEKLFGTPGVLARTRQNYAQDEQISIRGFGTRASFGIRSVRVYVDGLPATLPDGQGQVSNVPLAGVERIEVLRGPFAALYGNGAGGVVHLFTPDGGGPRALGLGAVLSSFDTSLLSTTGRGELAGWSYASSSSYLRTDGYREHSRARRDVLHGKAARDLGPGRLTLVLNAFDSPDVEDPQGLTRAQVEADPRQGSPAALAFDTRKSARQWQLGAIWEQPAGPGALRLLGYGGERRVEQVLGTPAAAQRAPTSAGGWIDLRSPLAGLDARWSWRSAPAAGPLELVLGVSAEAQRQARRGYENFVGPQLGVRGALRQDQDDRVRSLDPYVQAHWDVAPDWTLSAGLRRTRVRFDSRDRYIAQGNADDSGAVEYRGSSPVIGATWRMTPALALHAATGRGFETPTFNELAYRTDGAGGPNFALRPMRTRSAELGLRLAGSRISGELTAFGADTRDELAVNTSTGGRTTFRNLGRARRAGIEGALRLDFGDAWQLRLGATWLDASYRDAFAACTGVGCTPPVATVAAGTRLPGVPRTQAHAALRRGGALGWHVQGEAQHVGDVTVDTAGSERADRYVLLGASAGYGLRSSRGTGRVFIGVANLLDRAHVGSVIVNESNRRYFEPGAGRTLSAGFEWQWND